MVNEDFAGVSLSNASLGSDASGSSMSLAAGGGGGGAFASVLRRNSSQLDFAESMNDIGANTSFRRTSMDSGSASWAKVSTRAGGSSEES